MQITNVIGLIFMLLYFYIVWFFPYIIGIIISIILIIIAKKIMTQKARKITYIIIIIICCFLTFTLSPLWYKYAEARPNDTYSKMQEMNEKQSLIGLSKAQVIELLGNPQGSKDSNIYYYEAGTITNYLTGGTKDFYTLQIIFDENEKVKATSIHMEA